PPHPLRVPVCTFPPADPRLEPTLPGVEATLHYPPLAAKLPNPYPAPRRIQDAPLQATLFLLPRIVFPIRSTPPHISHKCESFTRPHLLGNLTREFEPGKVGL